MNIYNFLDDEPVIVKGKEGKDKIQATVPAGSFVVPKENTPVAVKLTNDEMVIPPGGVPALDAKAKAAGLRGIKDLAPKGKNYTYPPGVDIPDSDREGWTESQLRDRNAKVKIEEIENHGIYKDYRKANPSPMVQGYNDGGFVIGYDENGNPIEDMQPIVQKPIQPVVNAAGSKQIIANNAEQAARGQAENNAVWNNIIPIDQGVAESRTNAQKIQELIGASTPKFDEQKAQRLQRIAAINSIGQGISAAFSGAMGRKGGPVLNTNTPIVPGALAEYNAMVKDDKDNKYRTALAKANAGIAAMKEEQDIIAKNKAYNQQLKAEWNKLTSKITLEDIQERNKRAARLQELLYKKGIDIDLAKIDTENKLKIVKEQGNNAKAVANINQSSQNARQAKSIEESKRLYPNGKPQSGQKSYGIPEVIFKPKGGGKDIKLTGTQVGAMIDALRYDNSVNAFYMKQALAKAVTSNGQYNLAQLTQVLPSLFETYGAETVYDDGTPPPQETSQFGNAVKDNSGILEGNDFE